MLITGANGWVASNIIFEALALGFRIRGTVRTKSKIAALEKLFVNPNYSTVMVEDFEAPGAFDEALQDVNAIFITATKLPGPANPNDIIPGTIAGVVGVLKSALSTQESFPSSSDQENTTNLTAIPGPTIPPLLHGHRHLTFPNGLSSIIKPPKTNRRRLCLSLSTPTSLISLSTLCYLALVLAEVCCQETTRMIIPDLFCVASSPLLVEKDASALSVMISQLIVSNGV